MASPEDGTTWDEISQETQESFARFHREAVDNGNPKLGEFCQPPTFASGVEAMRRAACIWLRAQANAERKLRLASAAGIAFVEAHNAILRMPAPEPVAVEDQLVVKLQAVILDPQDGEAGIVEIMTGRVLARFGTLRGALSHLENMRPQYEAMLKEAPPWKP